MSTLKPTEMGAVRQLRFTEAVLEATDLCMEADASVHVLGLGVADPIGIFGTTAGLADKYGHDRVMETPTAENGSLGIALGGSLVGLRPIITHQRVEFALLAIDQIVNQAAKWNYMTGGRVSAPIVIRLIVGRGWGQGPQHSQSLESWFAHIPGLRVVLPSTPNDAKGLLISSVRDNNPVVFIEHRWLHDTFGEVPRGIYQVPLGEARVARQGRDITIVSYSYMTVEALKCADALAEQGIDVEVLDLRSLRPLDEAAVLSSVRKTGRLLALDLGWSKFGVSSEVIALAAMDGTVSFKGPPERLGVIDTPIPSTRALADLAYPGSRQIADRVLHMLGEEAGSAIDRLPHVTDIPDPGFRGPF